MRDAEVNFLQKCNLLPLEALGSRCGQEVGMQWCPADCPAAGPEMGPCEREVGHAGHAWPAGPWWQEATARLFFSGGSWKLWKAHIVVCIPGFAVSSSAQERQALTRGDAGIQWKFQKGPERCAKKC